jgi:hypothetical protein
MWGLTYCKIYIYIYIYIYITHDHLDFKLCILMPEDDGRWLKHVAFSAGFNKFVLSDVNI